MNNKKPGAAGLRVAQTRSMRRRIAALLRAAHRVVGLRRKRLALGFLTGSGSRIPGGTAVVAGGVVAMLTSTMALTPLPALANVISTTGTCNSGSGGTVGRIATGGTGNGAGGIGYPTAGGSGTYALAAGCNATVDVSVLGGTAYGGFATVTGQGGIAVGFNSQAGTWSLAAGLEARATSAGSTAVGFGSQALSANSIAIGGAGGDGTTALSVANSTIANAPGSIAIGANASRGAQTGGADSIAIGGQSTVASGATSGIALGRGATVSAAATNGIAQGDGASAQSANDVAIGRSAATASGSSGSNIALGDGAVAGSGTAANAIAIGKGAQATGVSSLSIGTGNKVSGANSGAIGDPTTITGAGSYSLGNNNTINANKAFVVGSNVTVATGLDGSIVLGDGSTIAAPSGTGYATGAAAPAAQMSIGAAGTERRITNLAAGSAATDAVNVSQLGKIASNTANTTGGSYDAAGTYTAPTFSVGGTARTNLAAAVNAQDAIVQNQGGTTASTLGAGATYTASTGAISGFSQPINSVSTTGAVGATSNQTTVGAALGALNTDVVNTANIAVKYDSAGGSTVTLGATGGSGAPMAGVRITNLTPGTLSASSTDAVNGGQLFVTNSNVTTLTNNVANGTIGPVQQTTVANSLVLVEPGKTGGNPGAAQTLGNLAAGVQNSSSLQAVNASQLFTTGRSVATVLGGSAAYNPGIQVGITGFSQPINGIDTVGTVNAPTSQTTVAGALTALNNNTANTANIAVKYDSATSPGQITLGATGGVLPVGQGTVKITNLTAGTAATDAVNVSQLQVVQTLGSAYRHVNSVRTGANSNDGSNSGATGQDAIAVGVGVRASGAGALAIGGLDINPSGPPSYFSANAAGDRSIALGVSATAGVSAQDSIAIGSYSTASGAGTVYVGTGAGQGATGDNSIGIGASAGYNQSGLRNLSIGNDAGASSSGQRNTYIGSLNTGARVTGDFNTAIGSQALGSSAGSTGSNNTAVGMQAGLNINGDTNAVLGAFSGRSVTGSDNVAVGNNAGTSFKANRTISIGRQARASADDAVAIGTGSIASASGAISIGNGNIVSGIGSAAIGDPNTVSGSGSYAIGNNNTIAQNNSFVLGNSVTTTQANSVVLGNASADRAATTVTGATIGGQTYTFAGAGSAANGVVSVGAVGAERQIINLAAGELSATSTDAVNGSQLFATNTAVTNIANGATGPVQRTTTPNQLTLVAPTGSASAPGAAQTLSNLAAGAVSSTSTEAINGSQLFGVSQSMATHLGGGSTVNTDGTVSAPAYTIGTTTYSNVGSALTAINTTGIKYFHANSTLLDSTATGTNSVAIGPNAVASNAGDVALGSGSTTAAAVGTASTTINGTTYTFAGAAPSSTVSVGAAGVKRTITNVAAGRLSASSTDAINGSQLYATNQAAGALGTQVTNLGSSTATALGGGASSSATGTVSAPTYNVGGGSYSNVGDALTAIDGTASKGWNLQANGDAATQVKPGNTVQLVDGQNIKVTRNGADVTIATAPNLTADSLTINGGPVIGSTGITNLAPGALNATSTEAVNGSQLFATNQNLTGQTTNLNNLGMTTASTLGAGAAYDPATGKVAGFSQSITSINPDGTIGTTTGQTTVAGALTALDANTTNLANNLTSGTIGPVQRTATPNQLALIAPGGSASAPGAAQRLTNLAAGAVAATSTDGVNGSQLFGMSQSVATNLGGGSAVNPDGTVSAPSYTIGTTTYGNVGSALAAINTSGIKYFHANSTLADSQATGTDSVAIGPQAVATNAGDVALGKGSVTAATVGTTGATIAGTAYSFAGTTPSSTVSVGAAGAERTITNVAAGRLSSSSTDAVNGSQLFAANQAIDALGTQTTTNLNNLGTTTASTLGGGATYDPATGKISAFSQPITNITTSGAVGTTVGQTTVAGALTALDANTTNLANNLTSGTIGPVQRTATPNQLTLVAPAGSASTPGAAQTLSNLAAGVAATDAVNVSQLQAVQTLGNAYRNVNSVRTGANSNDGSNSGAVGQDAMAFGVGVRASGTGALAIGGMDNNPSGPASYISANAAGNRSVAIGVGATTGIAALNGIAIGSGSVANAPSAIYIGTGAGQSATGNDNSIGIGASAGNAQSGLTNLSVGVNAGASSSGQRNTYVGSLNTAGKVTGDFNTAIGSQAMFSSVGSTGSSNTAVGMQAGQNINGNTNTVLGAFSGRFVTGSDNVAVGNNAGSGITASGTVSIGRQAMASAAGAIAIGTDSAASLSNSVVLGNASTDRAATTVTGTTIGGQAYTFAGAGSVANGVVSVGAAGKERQIINLAAGDISATSTDAINGSQLFATNTAVTNIASGATGTVQRTPAANQLALVAPGGSGAAPGAAQTLTNLAPGALSATSTDAVNGSQLFAANATITTLTSNVANLGSTTANTLGGGAAYDSATGAISGFSQPINGISTTGAVATSTPQTTVGEALAALNSNAVNLANIAVKYDAVGGNTITLGATGGAGGPAGGVKIANLMAGTADSDAVNVGQLKAITPHYLSVNDGNQVRGNYDNKGATGIYGIAIGVDAASIGAAGVAIGKDAAAQGSHTVAIGMSAGSGSSSPGSIANVAIGADSGRDVSGQVNTAVGYAAGTTVNGTGNVATGTSSGLSVTGDYNAAFGSQSGSIVVGFNNLAMGTNAGFTVSGSLNTASGANSGQNVAGDRNSAMGPFAGRFVTGSDNVALGTNAGSNITADRTISIGRLAMASAADAVAIGTGSIASASGAISIGTGNIVSGIGSAAIGDPNTVSGSGSYAIGNNNTIAQNNSFVLGNTVTTTQANSVVLGNASADRAATTVTGATIGGQTYSFAGAGSAANGVVSVGGVGTERQIVNLAAGELSATSTDAVNGSQLFATNQAVTSIANGATGPVQRTTTADQLALVAPGGSGAAPGAAQTLTNLAPGALNAISTDAVNGSQLFATNTNVTTLTTNVTNLGSTTASTLGGGATYDPATGKVAGFSQSITNINPNGTIGTTIGQTTVAGALTALDVNTTNLANNLTNGAIGPVQRTVTPNQLTLVAPGGTAAAPGAAQTLTNLAPGALNAASTDAVNGSQLFATNTSVTTLTTNTNNLGSTTASTLGGGATYDPATGKVAGFSQPITGIGTTGAVGVAANQTTVGDALAALNANAVNLANIAVKYDAAGGNTITLGATGGGGGPAGGVKITNLTAGTLSATSTDAVNGSQLYATNQTVTNISNGQVGAFGSNQATTKAQPVASGTDALAGGFGASATGAASSVIGNNATDNGVANSTVLGNGASIAADLTGSNVALGQGSTVVSNPVGTSSAAVGGTTYNFAGAAPAGTVSVGSVGAERTVTNVAAGRLSAASTDAVNGSQLFATNSAVDQLNTQVTSINNGAAGPVQRTGAANQLVLVAPGGSAVAPGAAQTLTNLAAGALSATSTDAVTGSQLHATNQSLSNIQNGGGIKYFHANSTAADSQAVGVGSVAAGPQSVATGTNSVALGNGAAATNAGDVALGSGSTTAAAVGTASGTVNGTVYSYAGANPTSTVSVGSAGSERTVTNVAAGRVTAMSTDAVNGSQLFATNSAVNSLATSLGDGGQNAVRYDRDGSGQKTNTVTLLGGDPNAPVLIKNVATGVADSDAANVGQVKQATATAVTAANGYTDLQVGAALQTSVSYTNQVAAATLSQANAYTDMRFGQLSQQIGEVQKEARQAAAIGLAASSLRYDERPGKLSAAVGGGVWKGYAAGSMGLGYTSRDQNVRANVSATTTGDSWGIGAGLSFTLN